MARLFYFFRVLLAAVVNSTIIFLYTYLFGKNKYDFWYMLFYVTPVMIITIYLATWLGKISKQEDETKQQTFAKKKLAQKSKKKK